VQPPPVQPIASPPPMPKEVTAPEVTSAIRQQGSSTGMTVATASIPMAAAVAALAAVAAGVLLMRWFVSIQAQGMASMREFNQYLGDLRTFTKVQNETLEMRLREHLQRDLELQADLETFVKRQDELQTLLAGSGK
jgi:hypothetical protein